MKTSYFLIFLTVYAFLAGATMLFNAAGSLQDYGVQNIDQNHISTIQFLGLTNIGLGINSFLFRNANADNARNVFITSAFLAIGSVLKACYDVFVVGIVVNNFVWGDMTFRLLVGLVAVYFAWKVSQK
jgi:hypothetical protein